MKNQSNEAPSSSSSSVHLAGFAPAAAPSTLSACTSATKATGSQDAPPSNDAVAAAASTATATAAGGASDSANTAAAAVAAGSAKKKRGRGDSSALHGKKNPAKKSLQSHYKLSSGETSGDNSSNNKKNNAVDDNDKDAISADRPLEVGPDFKPLTLHEIQARIQALMDRLPTELPAIPEERMIQFGDVSSEKREFRISNMGVGSSNDDLKIEGGDVSAKTDSNGESNNINKNNNTSSSKPQEDCYTTHYPAIHSFASNLQTTVESFNLLLSLVSSATYQWGVDRSGASQQNLAVMSSELQQCQEVISSVVSSRLSNVLCPSVDVLVGKVEIVREGGFAGDEELGNCHGDGGSNNVLGESVHDSAKSHVAKKRKLNDDNDNHNNENCSSGNNHGNEATTKHNRSHSQQTKETRINHYTRPYVDPNYVHLCHVILARNAPMIRHVIASCLHSAQKVIGDYLTAAKKDVNHSESGRGYAF